jgi:hypothetical protein
MARRRRTGWWLGGGILAGVAGFAAYYFLRPARLISVISGEGIVLAQRRARLTDAGAVAAGIRLASNYPARPVIVVIWTNGEFTHGLVGASPNVVQAPVADVVALLGESQALAASSGAA